MSQEPMQTTPPEEPRDVTDQLRLWGTVAAGVALILFFFQNLEEVEINFLWFAWTTDMIWALITSALLGAVGMFLGQTFWNRRRRKQREE